MGRKLRGDATTRFWRYVERGDDSACWPWTGYLDKGYGRLRIGGAGSKKVLAHRFSYELLVGPIPEGLHIDHLCRNRACVNPAHMEPVTLVENVMRGEGRSARQARATHCKRGHPFDEENTRLYRGQRCCRACARFHAANSRRAA